MISLFYHVGSIKKSVGSRTQIHIFLASVRVLEHFTEEGSHGTGKLTDPANFLSDYLGDGRDFPSLQGDFVFSVLLHVIQFIKDDTKSSTSILSVQWFSLCLHNLQVCGSLYSSP